METKTERAPPAEGVRPPEAAPARRSGTNWLQNGAHVAEILGVIVVIVSLFFLSQQVQQNTNQLRRADLNATQEH